MSALLAVETSGTLCSLAIHADGCWHEDTRNVERLHNRLVLQMLDALTASAGIAPNAFEAVAFGAGPGSFTGVRIAASVSQGVAFASNAVTIPVSSSLALAVAARRHPDYPAGEDGVVATTRSRRDAYYVAAYRFGPGADVSVCLRDRLHQGDRAPADVCAGGGPGAGDRPPWWPERRLFIEGAGVTARIVGELARGMLARGEGLPPEGAVPVYVSGDSPWRPMKP